MFRLCLASLPSPLALVTAFYYYCTLQFINTVTVRNFDAPHQNIFVESDLFDPLDLFLTLVRVMGWSRQLRMTWQNLDACNAEQSHLRSRWRPFCTGAQTLYFLYLARELVANNIFSALKGQFVCKNNKGWMGRWRKDFCKEFWDLMLDKTFLPLKRI